MPDQKNVHLCGRILITGTIQAVTGLHIGKGNEVISIGGVDNQVMRNPLNNQPFIPGSSLKGKMRSLAEKRHNLPQNFPPRTKVQFHVCERVEDYLKCKVCPIYGVPGDKESSAPTRLVVRDIFLTEASRDRLLDFDLDQPFTELKYEATIDRVTAEANPRPLERVPAGAEFGPFEMVFSIYGEKDFDLLPELFQAMNLLEDDYLGGSGSRGSGKICFKDLAVTFKPVEDYLTPSPQLDHIDATDLDDLLGKADTIKATAKTKIKTDSA